MLRVILFGEPTNNPTKTIIVVLGTGEPQKSKKNQDDEQVNNQSKDSFTAGHYCLLSVRIIEIRIAVNEATPRIMKNHRNPVELLIEWIKLIIGSSFICWLSFAKTGLSYFGNLAQSLDSDRCRYLAYPEVRSMLGALIQHA